MPCASFSIVDGSTGTVKHWKWCTWHRKASAKNSSKLNKFLRSEASLLMQDILSRAYFSVYLKEWMFEAHFYIYVVCRSAFSYAANDTDHSLGNSINVNVEFSFLLLLEILANLLSSILVTYSSHSLLLLPLPLINWLVTTGFSYLLVSYLKCFCFPQYFNLICF